MASKLAASATTSAGPDPSPMRRPRSDPSMSSATARTRSIGRTARPAHHHASAAAAGPSATKVAVTQGELPDEVSSTVVVAPSFTSMSVSVAAMTPASSSTGR